MFAQLIASRPARQRSARTFAASLGVHTVVFGAAVYATLGARPVVERPLQQSVIYVPPEREPPRPVAPPQPHVTPAPPAAPPSGPPVVSVPIDVPTTLPLAPPSLPIAPPGLPLGAPFGHGSTSAVPGAAVDPGAAYLPAQVDEEVAIAKGSPMPRFPNALRALGVEGDARFRFVVDTLGRVELASVEQVQSTRDAFAVAVRDVLPRMRFRPARVNGRPVRQLVEFPIVFRLTR